MRLAQLTSGHLGGYECRYNNEDLDLIETQDISDEKLRWCVQHLHEREDSCYIIIWCRWRRERERLAEMLVKLKDVSCFQLYGGQPKVERAAAVSLFSNAPIEGDKKVILVAQPHAGGHGLNLIAATEHIFLSNDFSLGIRLQAEDRSHRPGQLHPVLYIDVIATGPDGQKTIDATIFKALRNKKSVAEMTTAQWRKELE